MGLLTEVWRWIKALARWFLDARSFWATLGVVLVVFIIGYLVPGTAGNRVRYCGMALQLLGIYTIVKGLQGRRRLFKLPSLVDNVRGWLGQRPRFGAKPQTISISGTVGLLLSGSGKVSSWRVVPPEASIEDRLVALLANVESLKNEQAETAKELQEETRKWFGAVDAERRMRESAVRDIRAQLDTLGAGDLHLAMAGVVWLFFGVVLATVPNEIAYVLLKSF